MLMVIPLLCGAAAALVLWVVRRRTADDAAPVAARRVALIAAWTFATATVLAAAQLSLPALGVLVKDAEAHPPPVVGAGLAIFFFLHARLLLIEVSRWAYLWASRAPERFDRSWRMEARAVFWGSVGFAGMGAIAGAMMPLRGAAWSFLLLPLAVSLLPLYEAWLSPWLQFWRAGRLADTPHAELDAWLAQVARERRLPRFHVRVHEGKENNAYALGGMFRNLVVVGGGLIADMTTGQLRAILAHEIAHVVRRDVLKLLVAVIAGGTCHAAILVHGVNPHVAGSGAAGPLLAMLYVSVAAPLAYLVLPGLVSRRLEFGADRLAAELLGDPRALADAIKRAYELRGISLDKQSIPHPTGNDRIAALLELTPPQGGGARGTHAALGTER